MSCCLFAQRSIYEVTVMELIFFSLLIRKLKLMIQSCCWMRKGIVCCYVWVIGTAPQMCNLTDRSTTMCVQCLEDHYMPWTTESVYMYRCLLRRRCPSNSGKTSCLFYCANGILFPFHTYMLSFAKKKNSKNPRLWKWVDGSRSHLEFFIFLDRPKIALNQY